MDAQSPTSRNERHESLFSEYLPLVKAVAGAIRRRLPKQVDFDDLMQAGSIGLLDAVRKFDTTKGVPFACYAKFRIRGAILDSLRTADELSRADRRRVKQSGETQPEDKDQHDPGSGYQTMGRSTIRVGSVSTRENGSEDRVLDPQAAPEGSPERLYERTMLRRLLSESACTLPPRHQQLLNLYYEADLTMREIADVLGVNESRISQMHKTALSKMAFALTDRGVSSLSGAMTTH